MNRTHHRVRVDGVEVHYERFDGAGEDSQVAPWLMLVHGAGCNASFWHAVVEEFAGDMPLLVIDLPGHGASEKPFVDYTMNRHARALLAVLDHAAVERVVLVAHSMGAAVCRQVVRYAAHRALALLVVDGFLVMEHPEVGAGFVQYYDSPHYAERFRLFVESCFSEETSTSTRDHVRASMLTCPQKVMVSQIAGMYDAELWQPVDFGDLPVALLAAGKTAFPTNYERRLREEIPQIEFRQLADAGHFLMQDRPAEVNAAVRQLLQRIECRE